MPACLQAGAQLPAHSNAWFSLPTFPSSCISIERHPERPSVEAGRWGRSVILSMWEVLQMHRADLPSAQLQHSSDLPLRPDSRELMMGKYACPTDPSPSSLTFLLVHVSVLLAIHGNQPSILSISLLSHFESLLWIKSFQFSNPLCL